VHSDVTVAFLLITSRCDIKGKPESSLGEICSANSCLRHERTVLNHRSFLQSWFQSWLHRTVHSRFLFCRDLSSWLLRWLSSWPYGCCARFILNNLMHPSTFFVQKVIKTYEYVRVQCYFFLLAMSVLELCRPWFPEATFFF